MQMYLKNFKANQKIAIELETLQFEFDKDASINHEHSIGLYSYLGEHFVGLFLINSKLFVLWNDEAIELSICSEIKYTRKNIFRIFSLKCGKRDYTVTYKIEETPLSTQFYSEDEEDIDFGLWIHNVLSSNERLQLILEGWREGIK